MGRMHHHDKHAASKDGHRPDDPHGVTAPPVVGNPRSRFNESGEHRLWEGRDGPDNWQQQEQEMLIQRQTGIQAVLDEPNIRREGHEVFDENANYGQRVSAFGKVERDASEEHGYPLEGDEAVDVMEGEEDQAFAKKAMYGQDMPPPPPPTSSKSSGPTGPPLSKWEQDHANVQNKRNVADVQQWHKDKASDKKVSDRLGIPTPPRQAPKWRDDPAPPPPR